MAQSLRNQNKIKKMKNFLALSALLFFGFSYAQLTQNVGDFSSLETYDRITVKLIPSDQNSIEISGSKPDDVQVVNKNRNLKIRMNLEKFLGGGDITVKVYYTRLNQISASEGSRIESDETLKNPSITLSAREGATMKLDVETNMADIKTSSGGEIELSGTANAQMIVCNAGGNYEAKNLKSKTATVTVNAGGTAEIFASDFVKATTRAGGDIYIHGNPKVEQKNLAGGKVHIY